MQEAIKNKKNYIGDIKNKYPKIYNSWRAILHTKKGKKAGCSEDWKNFRAFFNDVFPTYKENLVFRRLDITKPHGKDNFIWVTIEEAQLLKSSLIWLEYKGETKPLKYWADKFNLSLYGIRLRYRRRDKYNYTVEEILFGRKVNRNSKKVKYGPSSRSKASKMISAYKFKDKKNGLNICDIDIDWMLENIMNKPCIYCGDIHNVGCDRIDNNKGHTKDNVVPACYECNCARNNNFSYEEMLELGKAIKIIKEKRNNSNDA